MIILKLMSNFLIIIIEWFDISCSNESNILFNISVQSSTSTSDIIFQKYKKFE